MTLCVCLKTSQHQPVHVDCSFVYINTLMIGVFDITFYDILSSGCHGHVSLFGFGVDGDCFEITVHVDWDFFFQMRNKSYN